MSETVSSTVSQPDALLVYVTCPDLAEAKRLARAVIEERLAACANLLSPMQSLYWWEGEVAEETEVVLLLKTQRSRLAELETRLVELHSYECPCVVAIAIEAGHGAFLTWIGQETAPGANR